MILQTLPNLSSRYCADVGLSLGGAAATQSHSSMSDTVCLVLVISVRKRSEQTGIRTLFLVSFGGVPELSCS